jgi:mannose-6-phosphate isomerase-like protein (cupin superfamily)
MVEIAPGCSSIRHYHPDTEETYLVKSGQGDLELGEANRRVGEGDLVFIPRGVVHKISNHGEAPLELCVICVPPWTPDCSVFLERWDENHNRLTPAEPHSRP